MSAKVANAFRWIYGHLTGRTTNFSWIIDDKLAGSPIPTSFREILWLYEQHGIKSIITIKEKPLPSKWFESGKIDYFHLSGSGGGGIMSAISNVIGGSSNNLSQDHDLVKHVQQTCGIQDPQQATQYTQGAVGVMNEHGNSNPQGLQSLLSGLTGGGSKDGNVTEAGEQQDQKKKKGLLGDVMGSLGI